MKSKELQYAVNTNRGFRMSC